MGGGTGAREGEAIGCADGSTVGFEVGFLVGEELIALTPPRERKNACILP